MFIAGGMISSPSLLASSGDDAGIGGTGEGYKRCFLSAKCNATKSGNCTGHWC